MSPLLIWWLIISVAIRFILLHDDHIEDMLHKCETSAQRLAFTVSVIPVVGDISLIFVGLYFSLLWILNGDNSEE